MRIHKLSTCVLNYTPARLQRECLLPALPFWGSRRRPLRASPCFLILKRPGLEAHLRETMGTPHLLAKEMWGVQGVAGQVDVSQALLNEGQLPELGRS